MAHTTSLHHFTIKNLKSKKAKRLKLKASKAKGSKKVVSKKSSDVLQTWINGIKSIPNRIVKLWKDVNLAIDNWLIRTYDSILTFFKRSSAQVKDSGTKAKNWFSSLTASKEDKKKAPKQLEGLAPMPAGEPTKLSTKAQAVTKPVLSKKESYAITQEKLAQFVDFFCKQKDSLSPFNPYSKLRNAIERKFDLDAGTIFALIEKMVAMRLVDKKLETKGMVCPTDGTKGLATHFSCPFCNSTFFESGETIEHLLCGHIDFSSHFFGNKCPKCSRELSQLGVDYSKTHNHFKCLRCSEFFGEPYTHFECQECNRQYDVEQVKWEDTFSYKPAVYKNAAEYRKRKNNFLKSIESQLTSGLPDLPRSSNDLVVMDNVAYPRITENYLALLTNLENNNVVYFSFNKTAEEMCNRMEKLKLDTKKIHFVECLDKSVHKSATKCKKKFGKYDFVNISKSLDPVLKRARGLVSKKKSKNTYVFFDSCNTMHSYFPKKAHNFIHALLSELESRDANSILLAIKDRKHSDFLTQLIQYSDRFYEL